MTRSETAKKASHMDGDKLYQKRARAALPLLVRQARVRRPITYEDLANELGMPNPRNLNYVLGCVGTSLKWLGEESKQTIPQIQVIIVNKKSSLPGPGIDGFLEGLAGLAPQQRLERVQAEQSKVYEYRQWGAVLDSFGLQNAKPPVTTEEILRCLSNLAGSYDRDQRNPPDLRRRGQFVVGWKHATSRERGQEYTTRTLESLTWRNLGFRFGQYFGELSKEDIEQVWTVLASHHKRIRGTDAAPLAEEIDGSRLVEGAGTRVLVNAFERNSKARDQCLAVHGVECAVCGLNFGKRYGPKADGYIHVHHLRPLSEIRTSYTVDPKEDLRPVCPNCHAVIHLYTPPLTLEEVGDMLVVEETAGSA